MELNPHIYVFTFANSTAPFVEDTGFLIAGFLDRYAVATETYVFVHDLDPQATPWKHPVVVSQTAHLKRLMADNTRFMSAKTDGGLGGIMFFVCHGITHHDPEKSPFLSFRDCPDDYTPTDDPLNIVLTGTAQQTKLSDVVRDAKFVFLCCCHGRNVVPEYLDLAGSGGPDLFYFDDDILWMDTLPIFLLWLFIMLESANCEDMTVLELIDVYTTTIRRMMSIVKMFGDDIDAFWEFMQTIGMASDAKDEKIRQQLAVPEHYPLYSCLRLPGQMNVTYDEGWKPKFFRNFQNMCLVKWQESTRSYMQTWPESSPDEITFSDDPAVDVYLKRYQRRCKLLRYMRQKPGVDKEPVPDSDDTDTDSDGSDADLSRKKR